MEKWIFIRLTSGSHSLVGPFTQEEIKTELLARRIGADDLVYTPYGAQKWSRLYQVDKFRDLFLALPSNADLSKLEIDAKARLFAAPAAAVPGKKATEQANLDQSAWLLQFEGSQFGPFSPGELGKILDSGRLKGALYACKVGFKNWFPVSNVAQLASEMANDGEVLHTEKLSENPSSKRAAVRINLVATISKKTPQGLAMLGVCADISAGGMQVINSTKTPFQKNENVELMVSPVAVVGVMPFSVTATVAWVSHTPEKVGFKFTDFASNPSLQSYIERMTEY